MKRIILAILFFMLLCGTAFADERRLLWDEPTKGIVKGYYLYYWILEEGAKTEPVKVELPAEPRVKYLKELDIQPDTHYQFWVTAYNINGEGPPSNTVEYYSSVPATPVLRLVIEVTGAVSISGATE